ncbi:MAG: ATP synthase subunit I [Candidatus Acidiferrales bacterium]
MNDFDPEAIERRIQYFIVGIGVAIVIVAGAGWGVRAAEGAAAGAAVCWLNFLWLGRGATELIRLGAAQAGADVVRVPRTIHAKFFGRIVLLIFVVYAILAWLHLPPVAFLCGFTAVLPAIVAELGYEIARGQHRWNAP